MCMHTKLSTFDDYTLTLTILLQTNGVHSQANRQKTETKMKLSRCTISKSNKLRRRENERLKKYVLHVKLALKAKLEI